MEPELPADYDNRTYGLGAGLFWFVAISFVASSILLVGLIGYELVTAPWWYLKLMFASCLVIPVVLISKSTFKSACWEVKVTDAALEMRTFFASKKVGFQEIIKLRRAQSRGLEFYLLETRDGIYTIPKTIDGSSQLFETIKRRMPQEALASQNVFSPADPD